MPIWGISAAAPCGAWLGLVFPALLLNYFGQGALLLGDPAALENPFYRLVPNWGLYPLVALVDLTFLSANMLKIIEGGWFPIVVAALVFTIMGTWWRGRRILAEQRARDAMPLTQFVEMLNPERPVRVPGTAIFMARDLNQVPSALLHALKHNKALHERFVMMQVDTEDVPPVLDDRRLEIAEIGNALYPLSG